MLKKQWTKSTAKNCCLPRDIHSEDYNCNAEKPSTFKAASMTYIGNWKYI
jgi:hypothetical protein